MITYQVGSYKTSSWISPVRGRRVSTTPSADLTSRCMERLETSDVTPPGTRGVLMWDSTSGAKPTHF